MKDSSIFFENVTKGITPLYVIFTTRSMKRNWRKINLDAEHILILEPSHYYSRMMLEGSR